MDDKYCIVHEKRETNIDRNTVEETVLSLLQKAFKISSIYGSVEIKADINSLYTHCVISLIIKKVNMSNDIGDEPLAALMQAQSQKSELDISLIREFAEAHQGSLWYDEITEKGLVCWIELPLLAPASAKADYTHIESERFTHRIKDCNCHSNAVDSEDVSNGNYPKLEILIIDENESIVDFLNEELGKHIVVQTLGKEEISCKEVGLRKPDLILCNAKLANSDGFVMTRKLKDNFRTFHIPVILLSETNSDTYRLSGSECGADDFIVLPVCPKYLLSRIYKITEQRELLKNRYSPELKHKNTIIKRHCKDSELRILINRILDENIGKSAFSVDDFAHMAGIKRTAFYKRIKDLTGHSPNNLIKMFRMNRAAELLVEGKHTVSEVSWYVGIEDPFYFSKCFKNHFGAPPSRYRFLLTKETFSL